MHISRALRYIGNHVTVSESISRRLRNLEHLPAGLTHVMDWFVASAMQRSVPHPPFSIMHEREAAAASSQYCSASDTNSMALAGTDALRDGGGW